MNLVAVENYTLYFDNNVECRVPSFMPQSVVDSIAGLINDYNEVVIENTRLIDRIAELERAIRLTQEYVGDEVLPPLPGWSWYDALHKQEELFDVQP